MGGRLRFRRAPGWGGLMTLKEGSTGQWVSTEGLSCAESGRVMRDGVTCWPWGDSG